MRKGFLQGVQHSLKRNRLGDLLVSKDIISSQELKNALDEQDQVQKPLGRILVEKTSLSQHQLTWILGKQYALRTSAAVLMIFVSLVNMSGKRAHADNSDIASGITMVSASAEFARVSAYPALYGTSEKRSSNLRAFTKWTGMFDRFERDLKNTRKAATVREWQNELRAFKSGSIKKMARQVNQFVNQTRYITDSKNWGKSDYWATPAEFIMRGGDCEDFAIAKYTALRALGVPEERLRVMIVQDTIKNIPHAVLVVYTESGAFILDNQIKTLVSTRSGSRYQPIFSINRQAWWLHTNPDTGRTLVASAR